MMKMAALRVLGWMCCQVQVLPPPFACRWAHELHIRLKSTTITHANVVVAPLQAQYSAHCWYAVLLCCLQGAAMLWVHPSKQDSVHPCVVSHG
jgi:hypothetical protein